MSLFGRVEANLKRSLHGWENKYVKGGTRYDHERDILLRYVEGKAEERLTIAKNMLKCGIEVEMIMKSTDLTREEMKEKL